VEVVGQESDPVNLTTSMAGAPAVAGACGPYRPASSKSLATKRDFSGSMIGGHLLPPPRLA
jgi:hypothetical protein